VKCSVVEKTDMLYVKWFCFEVKWSELCWSYWGQKYYPH